MGNIYALHSSKETQIEWTKEKEKQWELTEYEEIKCRGNEEEENNEKEKGEKKAYGFFFF